ncbi:MAG: 30S ribosomal protein S13 [Candidatus Hadarchaeales archaeon]
MPEEFRHIVRIAGKDLSGEKPTYLALADLKGVGVMLGRAVAYAAGIDPFKKLGELAPEDVKKIENVLEDPIKSGIPSWMLNRPKDVESGEDIQLVETGVTLAVKGDIGRERKIRSRRGIRHELGLPVRGQRTRTTGRRGLTVGVMRKETRAKLEAAKEEKPKAAKEGKPKAEKEEVAKAEKPTAAKEKAAKTEAPKKEEKKE